MDVSTTDLSAGPATLIVQMSDTSFVPFPNETFLASVSTTTAGTLTYNVYRDSGNVLFGSTANYGNPGVSPSPTAIQLFSEGPLAGSATGSNAVAVANGGSGPYSLTLETLVTHTGSGTTLSDSLLTALPPPPCNCTLTFSGPSTVTICPGDAIPAITASEDCGTGTLTSPTVNLVSATTNGTCPSIITLTYSATTDCGDTKTFTQTVTANCQPNCTITTSVSTAQVGDTDTAFVADAGVGAKYIWSIMNGSIVSGQGTKTLTWQAGTDTTSPVSIFITLVSPAGCSSACSASVKLTPQPPKIVLGKGDAATIGFWQNKNGQAIISGAANSPALANWLATQFPCLYGNLANQPNSYIASNFVNIFKNGGSPKVDAQIMAVAFACYFTSSNLGGGSLPVKYGFNQSTGGTGSHTINVGNKGTDLGLSVNGNYTILDILKAASNWRCAHPTTPFSSAVNDLFNAINTGGDIS